MTNIDGDINDLSTIKGDFTINMSSIDTRVDDRDAHLRSGDFLDVENNPEIKFEITKADENQSQVITMKAKRMKKLLTYHMKAKVNTQ